MARDLSNRVHWKGPMSMRRGLRPPACSVAVTAAQGYSRTFKAQLLPRGELLSDGPGRTPLCARHCWPPPPLFPSANQGFALL